MDRNVISTDLERLDDESVKITVTVDSAEIDRRIKDAYRKVAKEYRFDGFRPGHAPRAVIDKMVGNENVRARATDDLLNESYPIALDETEVIPLAEPEFAADKLVEQGNGYSYGFTAKVKPVFELDSYEPVEIELPSEEATDEDVNAQLEVLKSYQYTFEEVEGRSVEPKDFLVLKIDATSEGEKVERLCNDERIYQLGNGLLPQAFDDKLIGLEPGKSVQFTLTPEDGIDGDKPVDFDVTVLKIREKVFAELDDEFAQKCGADDMADLRAKLVEGIAEQKKSALPRLKEDRALSALAERLQGEATEAFVETTRGELAQQLLGNLQRSGMTLDMYLAQNGLSSEQFQADLMAQAVDVAKQSLALDALARHLEMIVSDEDIESEFKDAVEDRDQAAKLLASWRDEGRIPTIKEALARSKATQWVTDNAVVSEEKPAADEEPSEKKAPAKKAPAKKAAADKADKPEDEKAPAKKAPAKKAPAKKALADKADKPADEKAPAKKAPAKKPAAKKDADSDKATE